MNQRDMIPGRTYLVQAEGALGFIGTGYAGIYHGMHEGMLVLGDAYKLNLPRLAMGIDEGELIGTMRIPAAMVVHVSEGRRARDER